MAALATTTWTGNNSSNWNDPANWTDGVPGSGDLALIGSGSAMLAAAPGDPAPNLAGVTIDVTGDPTLDLTGVTLSAGSVLDWQNGATSLLVDVTAGLTVASGAALLAESASGTCVISGDSLANQGQIAVDGAATTIDLGGGSGVLLNTGTIAIAAGSLTVNADLAGSGGGGVVAIGAGAVVELAGSVQDQALQFGDVGGAALVIDGSDSNFARVFDPSSVVSGFIAGQTIDLAGIAYLGSRMTVRFIGSTLTVSNGVQAIAVPLFTPNVTYSTSSFALQQALDGGTEVTSSLPCFCRGTRIATAAGEQPVEALRPGAVVRTASGSLRRVAWIGRRRVDLLRQARSETVTPILVRRHALADGVPRRDLFLSPDHALLRDGVLIPCRFLVNGATIAIDSSWAEVEYFHVELDTHDVLLAEGAPAESYLDTGNRALFEGAAATLREPGRSSDRIQPGCAKRATDGAALAAVRAKLMLRAQALGHVLTGDADLHLRADGRRIEPQPGTSYRFTVPEGRCDLVIVSRTGVPAEADAASTDRRRLGIALTSVFARGPGLPRELLGTAAAGTGFHTVERSPTGMWRWTDGYAVLPRPLLGDARELDLAVAAVQASWVSPPGLETLAA